MIVRLAPFVDASDLQELVRAHMAGHRKLDPEVITQLAPFLESSALSEMVRHYLKEESTPTPPAPPTPPQAPDSPVDRRLTSVEADVPRSQAEQLSERLRGLAAQLQEPDISPHRRAELAVELAKLGQEQAILAQSDGA